MKSLSCKNTIEDPGSGMQENYCTICCVDEELAEAAGRTAARRNARADDSFSAGAGGNLQQVYRASGNGWCLDVHYVPAYLVLADAY